MQFMKNIFGWLMGISRIYLVIGVVVVVIVAALGVRALSRPAPAQDQTTSGISHVKVESVAALSVEGGPLPVVGTVTSQSQASILAQTSGEIVSLSRSIGDYVSAGAVIGSFENSSQQAAVTQAEGAYEAAQAAAAKASGTTATNSSISSTQAATAAANAQASLQSALQSAYASLDDAVHTKSDALFNNPRTATPTLQPFTIPDSQLVITIQNERVALEATLKDASEAGSGTNDIDARATSMLADTRAVTAFLNDLLRGLNQAVPNNYISAATIAADQASIGAARTEANAALTSVTAAKSSYDAAAASAASAQNSATGGTESDIAAAQANLKSAQGTLQAAKANLEKTIIRSPISGTIVSLPVTEGDYVSAFSPVATVSNPGALYVDVYVTPDDAKTISVGNSAQIDGATTGTITFIAPAIDPTTGKIEVKVGISGAASALTDGETVPVTLTRSIAPSTQKTGQITIPIVAVKILPGGPAVFEVTASSTLKADPITLGSILGDRVVASGLTGDMQIVTDARGLSNGQTVIVDATSTPL